VKINCLDLDLDRSTPPVTPRVPLRFTRRFSGLPPLDGTVHRGRDWTGCGAAGRRPRSTDMSSPHATTSNETDTPLAVARRLPLVGSSRQQNCGVDASPLEKRRFAERAIAVPGWLAYRPPTCGYRRGRVSFATITGRVRQRMRSRNACSPAPWNGLQALGRGSQAPASKHRTRLLSHGLSTCPPGGAGITASPWG